MLEISLNTDINNIAFLEYMEKQEVKVNANKNHIWGVNRPPQADIEKQKNKNPENIAPVVFW
ncbi:MAG: hypothetical protein NC200_04410 [Candidatus Gastranaerophilales bacterium]|nr:hypothetical protein [Candidatus Gastranaerophilales bacterium]